MTEIHYDIARDVSAIRVTVYLLYGIIFILGVAGNSLVVYVVLRNKSMQTITNIFIANLAISDILMSLVAVPFTPIAIYMKNFTLPAALCKILPMTMGVSVYVSTLTSTAIAVDRYLVIVHPFVPRMKNWLCTLIIVAVWFISVLISMPLAVYQSKALVTNTTNQMICSENWPEEATRKVFTLVSFVLQLFVPSLIISVCYVKVSLVLRSRCRTKIGSGTKSRAKEEMEVRRKRRTNKMLIAMVSIFVVCWIPINVHWMVSDSINHFTTASFFTLLFFICHVTAMSSAVYNPFLYAWMNENFKKEFQSVVPCFFPRPLDILEFTSRADTNMAFHNANANVNASSMEDQLKERASFIQRNGSLEAKVLYEKKLDSSEHITFSLNHDDDHSMIPEVNVALITYTTSQE